MYDSMLNSFLLLGQLEYQDANDGSTLAWDTSGWIGDGVSHLWLYSEGKRLGDKAKDAEVQALFRHAISPW